MLQIPYVAFAMCGVCNSCKILKDMKVRVLLLAIATFIGVTSVTAQNNIKVLLKDGSELVGYISMQRPGESLVITSSKSTIILPATQVKSISDRDVAYSKLSSDWQQWADENNAVVGAGDNRTVKLSNIVTDKGSMMEVRILERGAKVKYLEMAPKSYSLKWDDLALVKCEPRSALELSGINRKYKLSSGVEYEGQYYEEIPGETMSLYGKDGVVEVFNTIDVVKDCRVKVNPNQSLFEQSDLIDIVKLRDGRTYSGVITERNYFDVEPQDTTALNKHQFDSKRDFLLIESQSGLVTSLNLDEVTEYRKEINTQYKPLSDVLLKPGQFMVDRQESQILTSESENGTIKITLDTIPVSVNRGVVSIESNYGVATQALRYKLVKAKKYQSKKNGGNVYGFTYEDLAKSSLYPDKSETSVNNTTKTDYDLEETGLYIYYNAVENKGIPFRVTKL
jgi:hypothetical protein